MVFTNGFAFMVLETILTFAKALTASPTYADDDTNQNNYGNKTSDEDGN